MKRHTILHLILGMLALSFLVYSCSDEILSPTPSNNDELAELITYTDGDVIPGQYIVVYKDEVNAIPKRAVNAENFIKLKQDMKVHAMSVLSENKIGKKEISQTYVKTIQGFSLQLTGEEVENLRQDNRISYIEQDRMVHVAMGGPPGGGGGGSSPQVTPWGITRVNGGVDGTGKIAYIIDSGIDASHPDLNVDVSKGFNAFSKGKDGDLTFDGSGHGTHVAGTVGAIDNEIGVIGVAAGATVVPVKVLNSRGSGSYSGVIAGVDYVATRSDCDAANMSLGGGFSQAVNDAVVAASSQCPFALAAGNESTNASSKSPASANGNNIYTVSSMAQGDNWSSFSNYGNPPVDVCAPGSSVYSTYNGDGYATLSGTSMASPHVCGILLLGNVSTNGTVNGDPDGNADPIAVH
ncbi:MAG: S8 family serine peptidase [Bacteroidia bacterium]|nr:S8 family serine peptidase [Bacteroidia bacterium]